MGLLERTHRAYAYGRRVGRLAEHLAAVVPRGADVLDVGCGDGRLARLVSQQRPDITITGIDVLMRSHTEIPVEPFDGQQIPRSDRSVDAVMFVDVLHHTTDPMVLLREAERVARRCLVVKDHTATGVLAEATLGLMDRVGNARHGVALPYNYWTDEQWAEAWHALSLSVDACAQDLGLYPPPADWLFGRSLHFVARLGVAPDVEPRAAADAAQRQT